MHVAELEANTNNLHDKFDDALANLEREADEKDEELAAANREVEQFGHRIYELEEEHDELRKLNDRLREDEAVDRERLEALTEALKDVRDCFIRLLLRFNSNAVLIFTETGEHEGRS